MIPQLLRKLCEWLGDQAHDSNKLGDWQTADLYDEAADALWVLAQRLTKLENK